MRLVIATQSLSGVGGSEVYVITIADHLQRLGHDVWLHALHHGPASDRARSLGVRVAVGAHELPREPDALVVQDGVVACELAAVYPRTPQVFVAHSDIFDLQLPPQLPGLVAVVVALYDRVERRVRALGLQVPVVRLPQPVDVERFKPRSSLRDPARVALTLGNYVQGERLELLRRACRRASLELRHIGIHGSEAVDDPREALNQADIVFGKARVIYEAMACGRAVYVFDHNGGEGWVTAENVAELSADNFGGQSRPIAVDEDRLVADLRLYAPGMGTLNRDFIVAHNSATKHTAALVDVLRGVAPRAEGLDEAPLRELARLVRLHHRADNEAFALHAHAERLSARVHRLESEVQVAREQAEAGSRRLDALVATRRWKAMRMLLRPLDRARSILRRRSP